MKSRAPADDATAAGRLRVLLPVVWGVGCAIGYSHPGDEYAMFGIGSILGTWVLLLLENAQLSLLPVLLTGCAAMYGLGRLLEVLRASRGLWTIAWLVLAGAAFAISLAQFPSVAAAVAKNGSLTAYAAEASQLGACAATLLLLLVAGVRAALRGGAVRAAQAARAGEPARHLNG